MTPSALSIPWADTMADSALSGLPLQARLRRVVVDAILSGRLPAGTLLPSSRDLATVLSVSRNTVTLAYQHLVDEGFLESRPRSGIFVAVQAKSRPAKASDPLAGSGNSPPDWTDRVLRSQTQLRTLHKPERWSAYAYPFVYGTYDPEIFPAEDFRECCVRTLARSQLARWTPDFETDDVAELIEQIRKRVLPNRGVFALDDEIMITIGAQQAYYLIAEAFFDKSTQVGLEEPGHVHARNSFSLREPRFIEVPVDADGLVVKGLPTLDYLFVTPSHQSPTTVTMSLERRRELLHLAATQDFVLIEDDYEAENLYAGEPVPALKSMDRAGRVIYVGSVSKSLSPALRLGFIVAPQALIRELRAIRHSMLRHPSAFLQHVYALFLGLGHHESLTRRVNAAMGERLHMAADALTRYLPEFEFTMPAGGASIWVRTPAWVDSAELSAKCRQQGVLIESGDVFFGRQPYPCPFFRLRLSSIPANKIEPGIKAMAKAFRDLAGDRGRRL